MYKKWIQKNPFFYFIKFKIIKSIFKENNKNMVLFVEISNNFIYNYIVIIFRSRYGMKNKIKMSINTTKKN